MAVIGTVDLVPSRGRVRRSQSILACATDHGTSERSQGRNCVMFVGERQNLNLPLINRLQDFDPFGQVRSPVHNDFVP